MKIIKSSTLLLAAALLAFFAIGVGTANAQMPKPAGAPDPAGRPELKLGPNQTSARMVVNSPEGKVLVTLTATRSAQNQRSPATLEPAAGVAAASPTYGKTCTMTVRSVTWTWGVTLNSTFWYNKQTLWQDPPYLTEWAVWPFSLSDKRAWNSSWSSTVRFANGQETLHAWPGAWSKTQHVYIQQDSSGNCTGRYY